MISVPPCFVYPHTHINSKYVTVDLDVSVLFCYIKLYYQKVLYLKLFSLTETVSTSPNLAKEGARSATIITRLSGSRFS